MREEGVIYSLKTEKGFGFIQRQGTTDLFVHFSAIEGKECSVLAVGERVTFEVVEGPGGIFAAGKVQKVATDEADSGAQEWEAKGSQREGMNAREEGFVKRFYSEQGTGFIRRDSGGQVFVHFSTIEGEGRRILKAGERVSYETVQSPTGILAASKVRKLPATPPATYEDKWKGLEHVIGIKELESGVCVLAGDSWFHCQWEHFLVDCAAPLLIRKIANDTETAQHSGATPVGGGTPTPRAVLMMLDAAAPSHKRQEFWPANIAATIRLIRSHPKVSLGHWQPRWPDIWKAPLVLFGWIPRAQVVSKHLEFLFLLSPSTRILLPSQLGEGLDAVGWPVQSSESELSRYFPASHTSREASGHALGNRIGPIILASHLNLKVSERMLEECSFSAPELAGIHQQQLGSAGVREIRLDQSIEALKREISQRLGSKDCASRKVLIFDDDKLDWKDTWDALFGKAHWMDGLEAGGEGLDDALKSGDWAGARTRLAELTARAAMVIVDLRLIEKDKMNQGELSGFGLLGCLDKVTLENASIPPLLVFTSSRQQMNERRAYEERADLFLTKPTRFDQTPDSLRFLEGISLYLHPAYGVLRECLLKLSQALRVGKPQHRSGRGGLSYATKFTELHDAIRWEIVAVRNTLGISLRSGSTSKDRLARDSGTIARSLGQAFEAVNRVLISPPLLVAIMNLRNLAAHVVEDVRLPYEDVPYLGLALLVAAVQVFSEQAGTDNRSAGATVWISKLCADERNGGKKMGPEPIDNALSWLMAIDCIRSVSGKNMELISGGVEHSLAILADQCRKIIRESGADRTKAKPEWEAQVARLG